jgi:hypothetical protein
MNLTDLITVPEYILTLPISKEKIKYRSFLVKEQRVLLQAQEEKEEKQIINSIISILEACTFNKIDIPAMNVTDFEYLLLNIRSKSAGSNININVKCSHCQHQNEINFSIDDIKLTEPEKVDNPICIEEGFYIEMQFPSTESLLSYDKNSKEEQNLNIVKSCLKSIIHNDNIYPLENYSSEKIAEFIDQLTSAQLNKLIKFIESIQTNYLPVDFKCIKCGEKNSMKFSGLLELFT